jgi:hypothetical protein
MAKTTRKPTKSKSKPNKKLPSARRLGVAILILTATMIAFHMINYPPFDLSSWLFFAIIFIPLLFCSFFLLARPDRPPLFLSIAGAIVTVFPICLGVSTIIAGINYGWEMVSPMKISHILNSAVVILLFAPGLVLCLFGAIKQGAKKASKIIGFIGFAVNILAALVFLASLLVAFVSGNINHKDLEAQKRVAFTIVWPDDSRQDLICGADPEKCRLDWQDSDYHIEVRRSDSSHAGASSWISVYVRTMQDVENNDWFPLYIYNYESSIKNPSSSHNFCFSYHNWHNDRDNPYVGMDDPTDCTTPFLTTVEGNLIIITKP